MSLYAVYVTKYLSHHSVLRVKGKSELTIISIGTVMLNLEHENFEAEWHIPGQSQEESCFLYLSIVITRHSVKET